MNYVEMHLGDYAQATAHLTTVEDGIYWRLLRWYYADEKPLPADMKAIQRKVRAVSKEDRAAVETIMGEFFDLREDGYHQARCDAEIALYLEKEPERELRKANEDNRMKRHRDERAALFKVITEAGLHAPWNTTITELRRLAEGVAAAAPATAPATETATPATQPATAPATPATATQSPVPSPQSPVGIQETGADAPALRAHATPAGDLCRKLKAAGIGNVNPGNLRLLTLLDAGATEAEFLALAPKAKDQANDPFAYLLGAVEGERKRAARTAGELHRGPMPAEAEPAWRTEQRERHEAFLGPAAASRRAAPKPTQEIIDVPAIRVG